MLMTDANTDHVAEAARKARAAVEADRDRFELLAFGSGVDAVYDALWPLVESGFDADDDAHWDESQGVNNVAMELTEELDGDIY